MRVANASVTKVAYWKPVRVEASYQSNPGGRTGKPGHMETDSGESRPQAPEMRREVALMAVAVGCRVEPVVSAL